MKTIKTILAVTLAAALFSGCEVNDAGDETISNDRISFHSSLSESRTTYTDSASKISVGWVAKDRIGLFGDADGTVLCTNEPFEAVSTAAATDFTSCNDKAIRWKSGAHHNFYAYYPYSGAVGDDAAAVGISLPNVRTVRLSNPHADFADYDFMIARVADCERPSGNNDVELRFEHLFAVVELSLNSTESAIVENLKISTDATTALAFNGGKVNVRTGAIDLSAAETFNEITLNAKFRLTPESRTTIPVIVPSGLAGKTFTFTATVNGKLETIATRTVPAAGLPAGESAVIEQTVAPSTPEVAVNLSADGTANCYYINSPALYTFDAARKGNGVAKTIGNLTYTDADLEIDPKSVLVLWYNCRQTDSSAWVDACPIDMSSIKLNAGVVSFRTPDTFVNGNVVLIALDQPLTYDQITVDADRQINNANILWSWNIVASENYSPSDDAFAVGGYTFMNRDLGAVIDPSDAANDVEHMASCGNTYQWGRKDAFPTASNRTLASTGLFFTPTFTPITALSRGTIASVDNQIFGATVAEIGMKAPYYLNTNTFAESADHAVKNPHLFYYDNTNSTLSNTWFGHKDYVWRNAWGDPHGWTATDKTIYDPCPVGWKLVSNSVWHAMVENGESEITLSANGRSVMLHGSCFPIHPTLEKAGWTSAQSAQYFTAVGGWFLGYLNSNKGDVYADYMGRYGFRLPTASTVEYLKFTQSGQTIVTYNNSSAATGMSVRCMRDE